MTTTAAAARLNLRSILGTSALAGALSAVVNALLYLMTRPWFDGLLVGPQQMPFSIGPVVLLSVVGALAAGAVYALLLRFTRAGHRIFAVVAVVVLLASLGGPVGLPGASVPVMVVLNVMHVVVFGFVMALVWARRAPRA